MTPPPSRPRAIRARSEGNSPRRHRHRRHHRHRSRSRHDPQQGDVQNSIGVPQQRAPAPSPPPVTTPPGDGGIAPDAAPFRNSPPPFAQPPPRAKSAPVERARPASSSGSEVPADVWFGSNTPPPGSWRPQPPRPVVPPPGLLSEPLRPNYLPPKAECHDEVEENGEPVAGGACCCSSMADAKRRLA